MKASIVAVVACAALLLAAGAQADPWTVPAGEVKLRTTYLYTDAVDALDNDGKRNISADFYMHTMSVLIEFGANEYLTAFAEPTFRRIEVGGVEESGHSHTDLGLRLRLSGDDQEIFAVQAAVTLPGDIDGFDNVRLNQGEMEYALSGLYGGRFNVRGIPGYITAEGGYRWRDGGPADEIFADFGLGWQPQRGAEVLVESLNVWGEGEGTDAFLYPYFRQHQVRASLLFHTSDEFSFQIGGFVTWDGQNVIAEDGVFVAGNMEF